MCLSLNERSCHCGLAHHSHGVLVHTARRLGELQGWETMFEVLHFLARLGEQSSSASGTLATMCGAFANMPNMPCTLQSLMSPQRIAKYADKSSSGSGTHHAAARSIMSILS